MLEIPESKTMAKQLNETVIGKEVVKVVAAHSPHGFAFYSGDPRYYADLLEGRKIDKVEAISGQVEFYLDDVRLVFNDGTNLRYYEKGAKLPPKHQLLVEFKDGDHLICTIQMYGGIHLFVDGDNDNSYYLVAKEKPSPLTGEFDEAYFNQLWDETKPSMSAKGFLATEQRIPGLGNGVVQDILFNAGIHPKTKLDKITDDERHSLYQSVKTTLKEMTDNGGRDVEKDLFGQPGGYKCILSKNTWQLGCPICGGPITKAAFLGGNVYFCPSCQELRK